MLEVIIQLYSPPSITHLDVHESGAGIFTSTLRRSANREFKKRGRGESETHPEVTFPISDQRGVFYSSRQRDLRSCGVVLKT